MKYVKVGVLLFSLFFLSTALAAQSSAGEVNGTVTDPSQAAVAGAQVTLVNTATRVERKATTNESGSFIFVNVAPGKYTLKVEGTGFKSAQVAEFDVAVNQFATHDVALTLGQVSETVNVTSQAELIQRSSAELGTVIQKEAVEDLPLNGRNFTQLLSLTPGATPVNTAQGGGVSFQDAGPSGIPGSSITKPSMHGQQNRSLLYFQDGFINTDLRGPIYGTLPIIDSLQEFKVQGHNDKAEFGGVTGGIVNVVSRSGGNNYHGSLFEFVRNNSFDARNPFLDTTGSPAAFRQNQFGASVGGPIKHDKTFWFGAWESWRYRKPPQTLTYVATPAELTGDFSNTPGKNQIYNPYSTRRNPTNNAQFIRDPFKCDPNGNPVTPAADGTQATGAACNKLPAQLISAPMQKLFGTYFGTPNYPLTSTQNYIESRSTIDDANSWTVKVDHRFNDNNSAFFRFSQILDHHVDPLAGTKELQPSDYHGNNYGGGYTRTIGGNVIIDLRAGILQKPYVFNQGKADAGTDPLKSAGFANVDQYNGLLAVLAAPWTTSALGNRGDSIRRNPDWSGSANLNWVHGHHNMRFGYQYIYVARDQINTFQQFNFDGTLTNNPLSTSGTGFALATGLLGFPSGSSGELPAGGEVHFRLGTWSLYGQDEWKINRKLTVNLGLRWDVLTQPTMLNNRLSNALDLFAGKFIIGAKQGDIPACNTSNVSPCFPGAGFSAIPFNDHIAFAGTQNFNAPPVYDNFGPRLGVAWEAMRNTVIRAGYGLYFDILPARSQYVQNDIEAGQWPWIRSFSGSPNSGTGSPLVNIAQAQQAPSQPATPWNGLQSTFFDDPHYKDGYSHQYQVEVQRQLSASTVLSVAYVGSVNRRLPYTGRANGARLPSPAGTPGATVDNLRAMPFMTSSFKYTQNIGSGNYNSLQTRYQRRLSHGLMTLISYTWSKSLDNSSGYFDVENGAGQGGATVSDFFNPSLNKGPSGYDITHFFSWFTTYRLPIGLGQRWMNRGLLGNLFGDWQVNYIFQARSGQPFNLNVGGDPADISGSIATVTGYSRPNIVPGANPIPAVQDASLWFDPNAFSIPSGQYGNFSRNVLRTSHVVNMDFSMFKGFKIGESREFQLRFEGFNVLNIQNLGVPATTTISATPAANASAGVGRITSIIGNPRQIQFGGRFRF